MASDMETFLDGVGGGVGRKYKYKLCFALKLPSICINQKCSMGVGLAHSLVI